MEVLAFRSDPADSEPVDGIIGGMDDDESDIH